MPAASPTPQPPAPPPPERKPWPMKWVVLAILIYMLFQVAYVFFSTRGK